MEKDTFTLAFRFRLAAVMGGVLLDRSGDHLRFATPEIANSCARLCEDWGRRTSAMPLPELPAPEGWTFPLRPRA